jgi:valyl-tRNA synthetase
MDHAGIATQAKVEERLRNNSQTKEMLGREGFIDQAIL